MFGTPLFGGAWIWFTFAAGITTFTLISILAIVATVYNLQQLHRRLVDPLLVDAKIMRQSCGVHHPCVYCHKFPDATLEDDDAQDSETPFITPCGKERMRPAELDRYIQALEAVDTSIKTENHCPHIGGIQVKPTYFYVFLGYIASAFVALVVKAGVTA